MFKFLPEKWNRSFIPMQSSLIGFTRDRTHQFNEFRAEHNRTRSSMDSSMGANLIAGESHEAGRTDDRFSAKASQVESRFQQIERDLSELDNYYKQRLHVSFDDDEVKRLDSEIEVAVRQIAHKMGEIRKDIKSEHDNEKDQAIHQLQLNIQRGHSARLRDLSIRFKDMQTTFFNRLRSVDLNTGAPNDEGDEFEDLDLGLNDAQQAKVKRQAEDIRATNEEIERLAAMMKPVTEMMNDLSQMIIEQGTILDRIDGIIEDSVHTMEEGNEQLHKAETDQKSGNKCYYIYIIIVFILIIVVGSVIIYRKQKSKKESK